MEEKVQQLIELTNNFIFVEYYIHTRCKCFKILNEYTHYAEEKFVLCEVKEGFEKAVGKALKLITEAKDKFYK